MDGEAQEEIIDEVLDEYEVPHQLHGNIKRYIIPGTAPSVSMENVNRAREEEGLDPIEEFVEPLEDDMDGGEE